MSSEQELDELHYIGNILSEQESDEFGVGEVLDKEPESDRCDVSLDSSTTSFFDTWNNVPSSNICQKVPGSLMAEMVATAHNQLQQMQSPQHNIYQFSALPAHQHQQPTQPQLYAVVPLHPLAPLHQQEPPPPYSMLDPQSSPLFSAFSQQCTHHIGLNRSSILNEQHQQRTKQGPNEGGQRPIPKLSAIRFDQVPDTTTNNRNLWSNRIRQGSSESSRKQNQRTGGNKQKSSVAQCHQSKDEPQVNKQCAILKKNAKLETSHDEIQKTPIRPIGFNPIEPVDKKKRNNIKDAKDNKVCNLQGNKSTEAFQKVSVNSGSNQGIKSRKKGTTVKVISAAQVNGQIAMNEEKSLKLNAPSSRFEVLSRIGSRSSSNKPLIETEEDQKDDRKRGSITGTGISSENTSGNRRNHELKKNKQAKESVWEMLGLGLVLEIFLSLISSSDENESVGSGNRNNGKKTGYRGSKNNSIIGKGIGIILFMPFMMSLLVFSTWIIRTGWEVIFGAVTWIGNLIISIFTLSFTVTRLSIRKLFRLIRLPDSQQQNRHRATVRNGRLRYDYYG